MPATITPPQQSHNLLLKLAANRVDREGGVIYGATVAKAGVQALGKAVMLDGAGNITRDPKLATSKVPVYTDDKTLETLMAATKLAGPKFKVREDHDDKLEARIGFSANFKKDGDRVSADLTVFKAYRNRELLFETAAETPDLIGLSIDAFLEFELTGTGDDRKALMRVLELDAVDIVDAGAITPGGLLFRRGVDSPANDDNPENQPPSIMAAPTPEEIMSALSKMGEGITALAKTVADQGACLAKLTAPPPAPDAQMKADLDGLKTQLSALTNSHAAMRRERLLLGFRGPESERQKLAAAPIDELEKIVAGQKGYLALVADARAANAKLSAADAHEQVRKTPEGREAYDRHLLSKGVTKNPQMVAA
jgi:hypothetical protein